MGLSGEKILVTGAPGQIGLPMVGYLAADNEVWGAARFTNPSAWERLESVDVRPLKLDISRDGFDDLPGDFTLSFMRRSRQVRGNGGRRSRQTLRHRVDFFSTVGQPRGSSIARPAPSTSTRGIVH